MKLAGKLSSLIVQSSDKSNKKSRDGAQKEGKSNLTKFAKVTGPKKTSRRDNFHMLSKLNDLEEKVKKM